MSASDGGPAFPLVSTKCIGGDEYTAIAEGMTLRDYFAAKVLPAVIAAYIEANGRCIGTDHFVYNTAAHAFRLADAMLAERAK